MKHFRWNIASQVRHSYYGKIIINHKYLPYPLIIELDENIHIYIHDIYIYINNLYLTVENENIKNIITKLLPSKILPID